MASAKNGNRRKRKYAGQKERTAKNKKRHATSDEHRTRRLEDRTQALIGQHVAIRAKDQVKPLVGTVLEVIAKGDERYPKDAVRRHGKYLLVRTGNTERLVSRHRSRPLKDD